jgi:hypothetical protein
VGGVKKCFLSLWQTALLSAEGKKCQSRYRPKAKGTEPKSDQNIIILFSNKKISQKLPKKKELYFIKTILPYAGDVSSRKICGFGYSVIMRQ